MTEHNETAVTAAEEVVSEILVADDQDEQGDLDLDLSFASEEVPEETTAAEEKPYDVCDMLDDKAKVSNGVWCDYEGTAQVLIARADNPKFNAKLGNLYRAHREAIDAKDAKAEKLGVELTLQAKASTVVLGFKDLVVDGTPVVYSPANALFLLKNSGKFKTFVDRQSNDFANYHRVVSADEKEKLKKLLSGA